MLLLDVRTPKLHGVQMIDMLKAAAAGPPTLLLTTFEDDAALISGTRTGARGFLLKGVTLETLVEGICTVAGSGNFLHAPFTVGGRTERAGEWRHDALEKPDAPTLRERDVLKLMTSGISNAQIAAVLNLGDGTVRDQVPSTCPSLASPTGPRRCWCTSEANGLTP